MTERAIAIFCAALDTALNQSDGCGDITYEIVLRARWLHDTEQMRALLSYRDSCNVFNNDHLTRLRDTFFTACAFCEDLPVFDEIEGSGFGIWCVSERGLASRFEHDDYDVYDIQEDDCDDNN